MKTLINSNFKTLLIAILLVVNLWFSIVIIRLENFRYAASLNMCADKLPDLVKRNQCLASTETRTSSLWHLVYAIGLRD